MDRKVTTIISSNKKLQKLINILLNDEIVYIPKTNPNEFSQWG